MRGGGDYHVVRVQIIKCKRSPTSHLWRRRGRGCIAYTHSRPRYYVEVSGQFHAPAAFYPLVKDPRYPLDRRLGGPQSRYGLRG
jgi:hypothetical protein